MKRIIVLGLACVGNYATVAMAQQPAKASPPVGVAELKRNIARVAAGTEGESDAFDNLISATDRRLVAYLKTHEASAAVAKNLGLDYIASADANHLQVLTYSYSSGGTRGTIHRPVLQWKNASGQLFAYSMDEECDFFEIHKLASPGRTLYLLLGIEKGNSQCDNNQARLVELKGNYLLLDNRAFDNKPALRLCNVEMEFDPAKQALRLDLAEYSTEHDEILPQQWYHAGAKSLALKFVGGRFVKSQ